LDLNSSFLVDPLLKQLLPGVQLKHFDVVQRFVGLGHSCVFSLENNLLVFIQKEANDHVNYESNKEHSKAGEKTPP
jgi:hypothetical protein